jgi:hypothetical protein
MNNLDHLIAKHGVMSSFSIARKISKNEFKSLTQKIKKNCKTKKEFDLLLKKEIIKKTNESISLGKIPGLVVPYQEKKSVGKKPTKFFLDDTKRTALLSIFGASIVEKVIQKKLNKDEMCFLILTIVNLLKLSDHDFKMFHQKNENSIDDEDFDDEEEDDDGYDE